MKNSFKTLLLILIITVQAYSQQSDISIIESNDSKLLLEYSPFYKESISFDINGERFTEFLFEGSISEPTYKPGIPDLKFRLFPVRLPGLENINIEIVDAEFEVIEGVKIPPIKTLYRNESEFLASEYIIDNDEYGVNKFVPENIVTLVDIGSVRGAGFGNIKIYPIQYNPSAAQIRKYSRIQIRMNFGSREFASTYLKEDEMLKGIGINYDIAKNWFSARAYRKPTTQVNSVLSSGIWYRFKIRENGIYKISGSQLLQLGIPSSTNPKTIKIYNNGGYEPSFSPADLMPDDLIENAIYVSDVGNQNALDADDYILFYGRGTSGWKYNAATKTFSHYTHHFSDDNIYWLTYGGENGKRMYTIPSLNVTEYFQPVTVLGKTFREDDKINILGSGIEWLGQPFSVGNSMTYVIALPALNPQEKIEYKIRLAARAHLQQSYFTVYEHSQIIGNATITGTFIGSYSDPQAKFAQLNTSFIPNFTEPRSELKLYFTSNNPSGIGYLDWYEIFYSRNLVALNDFFDFHTHDTNTVLKYKIEGFSSNDVQIFDVTDLDNVKIITTSDIVGNAISFQIQGITGVPREIFVIGKNGYKNVSDIVRVNNQNIHGAVTSGEPIEFIIIAHRDFKNAADRLKNHRESFEKNKLKTLVVDVDEVYNEFGGGIPSPMAIRNFLKYAYNAIPNNALKYVLLFGDGDFDYKRITTSASQNWIPPWETTESFIDIESYSSDDNYVIFDNTNRISLAIGRLAVRSVTEANGLVDKIIEYEKNPKFDPWKMRVTYIGDDDLAGPNENDGIFHTAQAEDVAAVTPNSIEKRKIYLGAYPTVVTATGRRKPAVNEAIVRQIDEGTLIINFSGHGNPRLWTHEQVFVRETDFPSLKNGGKYFYLIAATCNFSQFDGIGDQSGGEILVNYPNSGAIGVFSATRAVYAAPNRQMNIELFRQIFKLNPDNSIQSTRLGDGIYRTKQIYRSDNDKKYFLLGDPSTRLALPELYSSVDSINGIPTNNSVSVKALQKIQLTGRVNAVDPDFSATAQVVVYDASKKITLKDWYNFTYIIPGGVIFNGKSSISNSRFNTTFIIPKDISYDTLNGRITVYFSNPQTDGMGFTESFKIDGTDTTATVDNEGPEIKIYFRDRTFRPGDVVPESPLLIVDLKDESGINSTGTGIGHRIEAWLDEQTESINLNPYYSSKLDSYQEGIIEYQFGRLSIGSHTIKIRAWDVYNNASVSSTIFNVVSGQGLMISDVYNYPNPFSENTFFTFYQNQIVPVDVEIKIFSVAGRLLNFIRKYGVHENFVRIEWDGRDREGGKLANGVYLYKVIVKTQDGRFSTEAIQKLSIMR
ncbi:MAG: hypothetical protein IGBAC_1460 [Ignavibacteriae bacterium]|nr:MAG: hypothetical protein IGBAC_1460 [Ignavibacteriota bacterium]